MHSFWVAEINRGDFILSQCSMWLPCFVGWLIHSEHSNDTRSVGKKVEKSLDIPLIQICTIFTRGERFEDGQCHHSVTPLSPKAVCKRSFQPSCHITGLSLVFSECSFASCNLFIFKNFNLSSRLLNQFFLRPNSQFGFMMLTEGGYLL